MVLGSDSTIERCRQLLGWLDCCGSRDGGSEGGKQGGLMPSRMVGGALSCSAASSLPLALALAMNRDGTYCRRLAALAH